MLEGLFPLEPWNPINYLAHSDHLIDLSKGEIRWNLP